METRHRSYAIAAAGAVSEVTPETELVSLEKQVFEFFNRKGITVAESGIKGCHPLPRKNRSDKPVIVTDASKSKEKSLKGLTFM